MSRRLEKTSPKDMNAMQQRMGVVGRSRFLQQLENGSGDFATERHKWVDRQTFETIEEQFIVLQNNASEPINDL